jgi:hypothetical protein
VVTSNPEATMARELTAHQRDRARAMLAFQRAGKLVYADPQLRREMRAFVSAYPREPIVQRLSRDSMVHARLLPRAIARPRERRVRRVVASRDGPRSESDEPPLTPLRGFLAASVRTVEHAERRRAKAAAA